MARAILGEQRYFHAGNSIRSDWYYPVFVTWPSGFFGSYGEHVAVLRQGQHWPVFGAITSPYFLTRDLAGGVVNAPRTWMFQGALDAALGFKVAFKGSLLPSWQNAENVYEAVEPQRVGNDSREYPTPLRIRLGPYGRGWPTQAARFFSYWILIPLKVANSTLFLDGLGTGSWDVMLHRAHNLFRPGREFEETYAEHDSRKIRDEDLKRDPSGALAEFLHALESHLERQPKTGANSRCYQITLVGHSMGAIILNRALRHFRELPVTRIVYMAPACSIADVESSVVPFLQRKKYRGTKFHVLTLHPQAEADEINAFDVVPRGSLLEWIDNFFSKPTSLEERRFGKWVNLLQALQVFKPVMSQVTIKGFGVEGDSLPQKHGDFNLCPYWRESFWDPDDLRLYHASNRGAAYEREATK